MKATVFYRIAGVLLIVVAALNTNSLLRFWQVAGSMNPLPFPIGHTGLTYTRIVVSYELFCSLCVLFGAYLAWHLGGLARTAPQAIGALGWILFAYQLVGVCISFMFLSGLVRILVSTIAICVGCASWLSTAHRRNARPQNEPALG
jgi:hypothetical protein